MFHQLLARAYLPEDEKFYAVVTDVEDAFGTIKHKKLKKILNEVVTQLPKLMYFRSVTFRYCNSDKCFTKKFITEHDQLKAPIALDNAIMLKENACRKLIVKDEINYVIKRMKLHTIQHRIGTSKKYYLVREGLLQGDTLSTPLCNIYYGHMSRRYLKKFQDHAVEQSPGLFGRGMDDFIFISRSRDLAEEFLQMMENGFPDYSCKVQRSKTTTNFKNNCNALKYCGTILHPQTLQCRPDLGNLFGKNVLYASNLAMTFPQPIMAFIEKKMLFICTIHFKALYLDEKLNGPIFVIENLYEASYLAALKLNSLIASLIFAKDKTLLGTELLNLTKKLTGKMLKRYQRIVQTSKLKNSIDDELVKHTIRYAFVSVLQRKYSMYYKELKLPWVNFKIIPKVLLDECVKKRGTTKILSKSYFKL